MGDIKSIDEQIVNDLKIKYGVKDFVLRGGQGNICITKLLQFASLFSDDFKNILPDAQLQVLDLMDAGIDPTEISKLSTDPKILETQYLSKEIEKKELEKEGLNDEKAIEIDKDIENLRNRLILLNTELLKEKGEIVKKMNAFLQKKKQKEVKKEIDLEQKILLTEKILEHWLLSNKKTEEEVKEKLSEYTNLEFIQICVCIVETKENAFNKDSKDFFTHTLSL